MAVGKEMIIKLQTSLNAFQRVGFSWHYWVQNNRGIL